MVDKNLIVKCRVDKAWYISTIISIVSCRKSHVLGIVDPI